MAKSNRAPARGGKSNDTDKNSYVRSEFAIGAAIVCFVLGFFTARIAGNTNPLATAAEASQQNSAIPVQNVSTDLSWITSLEDQVEKTPDSARAWTLLGDAYYDTDQYSKAIEAYEKSLTLKGDNPNTITDLGVMYRRLGDTDEAIRLFDLAVSVDPKHEMSLYNKGIVLLHDVKDTRGAIAAWEVLAKKNPQFRSPTGQLLTDMIRGLK